MKPTKILFILLIINGLVACQKEKTNSEKFIELGDSVTGVLDEFEKARAKMIQVFAEFATNVEKYLTNNPKDVSETVNRWEADWKTVSSEVKTLESKFTEVESSAKKYFGQLELLTDNINNVDLRESEEKKNTELKERWEKVYAQAENDMSKIRDILQEGNDFGNVLLSSAMRTKIDNNITQMKGISRKAKGILGQLANFSIDGKKVLKGEAIATYQKNEEENSQNKKKEENKAEDNANQTVKIISVKASSYQAGEGLIFKPENVLDDNLQTWWSPKTSENLDKEWLTVEFAKEETIKGIEIHGGSHYPNYKNIGDLYDKNYRVQDIILVFSDGSDLPLSLQDIDEIQTINFPAKKTKTLRLIIDSVYPSAKWKDACISHLAVLK